jgi:hypothetical protein
MNMRLHKRRTITIISLVLLVAILLTIFQVQRQQITEQHAWSIDSVASAACGDSGTSVITVNFTNSEPADNQSLSMDVTAHDLQTDQTVNLGTIAPGGSKIAHIDTGLTSLDKGLVEFKLTWSDGHEGTDTRTATYEAVDACTNVTPTPSIPACVVQTAVCAWDAGDSNATTYSVTITEHISGDVVKNLDVPSDTTQVIFPAEPGKQYDCRVFASNDCGSSDVASGTGNTCPLPTPTPTEAPTEAPTPTPTEIPSPTPTITPKPTTTPVPPSSTPKPTATPIPPTLTPRPTIQLFPTSPPHITQPPQTIVYRTVNNTQTVVQQAPVQNPTSQPVYQPPAQQNPVVAQLTPIRSGPTARPVLEKPGSTEDAIMIFAGTIAATVIGGLIVFML